MPFGMLGWTAQMTEGNGGPYQYFRESLIGFMATHQPLGVDEQLRRILADADHRDAAGAAGRTRFAFQPRQRAGNAVPHSVLLDAGHGGGAVVVHPEDNSITGKNTSGAGNSPNFAQYFVAVFDHAIARRGVWEIPENRQGRPLPNQST